jgi:hypothetical protein
MASHLTIWRFAAMLFAALVLAASVSAATTVEYRERVESARKVVGEMLLELAGGTAKSPAGFDAAKVVRLRELLPPAENIETPYGPVAVSNAWLHSRLDAFLTAEGWEKRGAILAEIEERLTAIAWKLSEMESAREEGAAKDEEKRQLAAILSREEYQKPTEEKESWFERWVREFIEWLMRMMPGSGPATEPTTRAAGYTSWIQIAIIAAVAVLVAFIIYRLAPLFMPAFRRKKREKKKEERVILGERISADQAAGAIFADAERLAAEGDLRGAIRKGYIALLCELSDRKLIGIARNKTNRDYLRDIRRQSEIYGPVAGLTGSFERHWYGATESDLSAWEQFRNGYRELVNRI